MVEAVLYFSARTQRLVAAILCLFLAHGVMASCTPEPVTPMAAHFVVVE